MAGTAEQDRLSDPGKQEWDENTTLQTNPATHVVGMPLPRLTIELLRTAPLVHATTTHFTPPFEKRTNKTP